MSRNLTMRAWRPLWMAAVSAMSMAAAVPPTAAAAELKRQDLLWLERVTYGPTTSEVGEYLNLGRGRFLNQQLHPAGLQVPASINTQITALEVSHADPAIVLPGVAQEQLNWFWLNHLSV